MIKLESHYRKCAMCGKEFFVPDFSSYAYKRGLNKYFCKWSCLRKYDAEKENKKDGLVTCDSCVWFSDKYGFPHCTMYDRKKVSYGKAKCNNFKSLLSEE